MQPFSSPKKFIIHLIFQAIIFLTLLLGANRKHDLMSEISDRRKHTLKLCSILHANLILTLFGSIIRFFGFKSDAIFGISNSKIPYFDSFFKLSNQFNFAYFGTRIQIIGTKSGPDQKADMIFEINDPRHPYFDILFVTFPFKIQKLVVHSSPFFRRQKIFPPKKKLDYFA